MGTSDLELQARTAAVPAVPAAECADLWSRLQRLSHRFQLSYWVIRAASYLARHLPAPVCNAVAHRIGAIVYGTWQTQREATIANTRQVLGPHAPEAAVRRLARNSYINYFTYMIDFLRFPHLDGVQLERWVASTGWEHLDVARAGGRGAILVTLHLGCPDLAGSLVAHRGYPVNAIVESFDPPKLNELIQQQRLLKGVEIIPLENPTRRIINALRRNEVLALLVDRPSPDGVPVTWFGGTVRVPAGAAALALKTGARIIPAYCIRRPDGSYYGELTPVIDYTPTGHHQHDVQALMQLAMTALEGPVSTYPDQWYMFRRFWAGSRTGVGPG